MSSADVATIVLLILTVSCLIACHLLTEPDMATDYT